MAGVRLDAARTAIFKGAVWQAQQASRALLRNGHLYLAIVNLAGHLTNSKVCRLLTNPGAAKKKSLTKEAAGTGNSSVRTAKLWKKTAWAALRIQRDKVGSSHFRLPICALITSLH